MVATATKFSSTTGHEGMVTGPGCPTVYICGMPASTVGDNALYAASPPTSVMTGTVNVMMSTGEGCLSLRH